MKIPASRIDGAIKKLDPALKAALLYGPDAGLAAERANIIITQIVENPADPFRVAEINAEALKETPSLLADEAASICFGGGRRLIKLRNAGNAATEAVRLALGEDRFRPEDAFILAIAEELPPASSLRRIFESAPNALAVPCYNDDIINLPSLIRHSLKEQGFSIGPDAVQSLAERCQGDRLVVRSELRKLTLYMAKEKSITAEHVRSAIGMTTESTLDDVCTAVAGGDFAALQRHLDKAFQQGVEPIAALRSMQRYLLRLYEAAGMTQAGKTAEQAAQSLKPPVFFKQVPAFLRHMAVLNAETLSQALVIIQRAEFSCKQSYSNPEILASRALMEVTNLAKNHGKKAA